MKDKDIILLIIVCKMGYFSVIKILLKVGVDILICDGFKLLIIVVFCEGYICVVKELIKVGVSVNCFYCGEILLFVVC